VSGRPAEKWEQTVTGGEVPDALTPIDLLVPDTVSAGGDLESSPFLSSKIAPKMLGESNPWVAAPVDRTVHAHQGNCAHVADDSVIFDRLIRHCSVPSRGSEMT
jgi:hypothetical protein